METVKIRIDGVEVEVCAGATILKASKEAKQTMADAVGKIPTLYYYKGLVDEDASGVCVVAVEGKEELVNASATEVAEGMSITTNSPAIYTARRDALKQILAIHDYDCDYCTRNKNCELQVLLEEYCVTEEEKLPKSKCVPWDMSNEVFVRDNNKCIRCGRCAKTCGKVQSIGAVAFVGDGLTAKVGANSNPFRDAMKAGAVNCINCGQCVSVCPVGALLEKDHISPVEAAIKDENKFVVVQAAPAVRAGLGEAFGLPMGTDVEGKLPAALKKLGFDKVFDTVFGADLTIMEEAHELVDRIKNGGTLPMITSCCPGWVKYCEINYGHLTDHLSSCKAPHTMFGAVIKSYYAEKMGIDKENIVVVSVMPCTAKKFEITREDECGAGVPDVDYVITTRELAKMLKSAEVDFAALEPDVFDEPLGLGTGAGVLFGATGGVMEAALRTAVEVVTGKPLGNLEFTAVRGIEGLKEASYELNGQTVKVAVVSGIENARLMLDRVSGSKTEYQFIEIMACPGGCVNGGGQPHVSASTAEITDVQKARASALYGNDVEKTFRKSHENPVLIELYKTYLGEPGSKKAHTLLHTTYKPR